MVVALFCSAALGSLFIGRIAKAKSFSGGEFLVLLALVLAALLTLLGVSEPLTLHWAQLLAVLSGCGFCKLMSEMQISDVGIPIMSKVAALFIASTWLAGMMLTFSPRSTSFPEEYSALYSALYGVIILLPVMLSTITIFSSRQTSAFLMWITLLLGINLIGGLIHLNATAIGALIWPALILVVVCCLQLAWSDFTLLAEAQQNK